MTSQEPARPGLDGVDQLSAEDFPWTPWGDQLSASGELLGSSALSVKRARQWVRRMFLTLTGHAEQEQTVGLIGTGLVGAGTVERATVTVTRR